VVAVGAANKGLEEISAAAKADGPGEIEDGSKRDKHSSIPECDSPTAPTDEVAFPVLSKSASFIMELAISAPPGVPGTWPALAGDELDGGSSEDIGV
jgi:hypothetical protein